MPSKTTKEVLHDLSPYLIVYTDGTIERLVETPTVPPSPEDPITGVASKDIIVITPEVKARVFLPKLTVSNQKLPVLVYYHGVGSQSKEDLTGFAYKVWMCIYPSAPGGIDNPMINPMVEDAPSLSGLGCSRLLVCLAGKDALTPRGILYVETLKKSGWKGEVQLVMVDGEDHCFHVFDPTTEKAKDLIKRLASFIS
ncbi:unnamed protein product [Fraxinus pennsylvanica]|uniref:Alpha/beta hydrolase fold-3 domain-containing protein n=1 Tax=Fraxinus pennsylvanica TaxID=56036 RepID=A0AAD1ZPX7_9LAMI|nr:unnamed protein product [Fraxinus pennsylvanica]